MTKDEEDLSEELRKRNGGDNPSQIALEEARLRFQEESERRNSVESKMGTILTVDAIIVSVVGLFENLTFLLIGAMAVALISVIIGIHGLRVRDYHTPGKDIDDYLQYIDDTPQPIRRKLMIAYMTSISGNEHTDDPEKFFKGNRTKNDEKYRNLRLCQYLTLASLGLILLHSALTLFC
ncbi:hypothetical protein [Halapricum hydrolyticum]|uniref:Uncharacterized protein n=1 Tax=Halapricum hydrolyticum TaxID=2979991 RepID=A0AAE3LGE6_9EURY|nr:hypothetical protein [Halapricum hydrolyticum]MCU4716876.1 hypothetical protein [Halapricum hydrolyticum]MCU4725519.1 hypothetical protein [Halapricum hydrolyticum]